MTSLLVDSELIGALVYGELIVVFGVISAEEMLMINDLIGELVYSELISELMVN